MSGKAKCRNWERWQTYRRDRGRPPWIKVHRILQNNVDWIRLTDSERGQLVAMWILAADNDGTIPADADELRIVCRMSETPNLKLFKDAGFLEFGANVTPGRRHRDAAVAPTCQPCGNQRSESEAEAEAEAEKKPASDDAVRLSALLVELVHKAAPGTKPEPAKWPALFDRLNRSGRDWVTIEAALLFAHREDNGFVVLSPESLRRKFNDLLVHMERAKKTAPYTGGRQDVTAGNIAAMNEVLRRNGLEQS
ncbi:MAG: hypothetical protein ABFE13_11455 [Phycisphaerales bacterium]